ncbi:hypothetical protein, partial [Bifidobacterium longum]|uniref:hypothetical protein n=1 Tax=Bifidobacterium longum TaxID=216816 RepID=UPI0013F2B103
RARRLKPSGTLTNDHTDNEVQQNVTTPNPQQLIEHKHKEMPDDFIINIDPDAFDDEMANNAEEGL